MKKALLVFPHQLFADHAGLKEKPDTIFLVEDALFFYDPQYPCNFHKQKLVLHRASLQAYKNRLQALSYAVEYTPYSAQKSPLETVFAAIKQQNISTVVCMEPDDFLLKKRILQQAEQKNLVLTWVKNEGFLNTSEENQSYKKGKKRWFMADFYTWQRQRLGILVDENGKPKGGQWSFDEENRKKLPQKNIPHLPSLAFADESEAVKEAKAYIEKNFPHAVGSVENFLYPINHEQAHEWLQKFLKERLKSFGSYEDAMVADQSWLYHSVLTPMLNIGLLTPWQVVRETLEYARKNEVPLNSLEGFIRQIIGWREFVRATYQDLGTVMRTKNYWHHTKPIPASFYNGTTGIEPVDNTIRRVLKTGYCHHIERLMVLGGFLFLCEIEPDQIYKWFMEMFIDSYDWVMVPNVYGMSQNADGGLITTKPYFSGSNYIRKMSHYPSGDWADIWDALYWRWILKHADALRKNPRWSMMVRMAEKMDEEKKQKYHDLAETFLQRMKGYKCLGV